MENISTYREYLTAIREQLDASRIDQINFDEMSERLDELASLLAECERRDQERDILREDYVGRITGMLKAIAAVDRKREAPRLALREVDGLSSLDGQELIDCYRRTSARFRDAFPASFGHGPGGGLPSTIRDINAYK